MGLVGFVEVTAMRNPASTFANRTWFSPAIVPVDMPIGLRHLESNFCWCDPVVEEDQNGQEVVLHRHVTWN